MTSQEILDQFQHHGSVASFHYADDSGKEWQQGFEESNKCRELWKEHPDLHPQMREIKKHFLFLMEE